MTRSLNGLVLHIVFTCFIVVSKTQEFNSNYAILVKAGVKPLKCVNLDSRAKFVHVGISKPSPSHIPSCSIFPIKKLTKTRFKIYHPSKTSCLQSPKRDKNIAQGQPIWASCHSNSTKSSQMWSKRLVNKSTKRRATVLPQFGLVFDEDLPGIEVFELSRDSVIVKDKNKALQEEYDRLIESKLKTRKRKLILIAFLITALQCWYGGVYYENSVTHVYFSVTHNA